MWRRMNQTIQTISLKPVLRAVAFDWLRPLCRFNAGAIRLRCFVNGGLLVLMLCAVYGPSRAARVVGVESNLPRLDLTGDWKAIPDKPAREEIKKSVGELRNELNRLERKLLDTRRQALAGTDDKQSEIEKLKREIAQVILPG